MVHRKVLTKIGKYKKKIVKCSIIKAYEGKAQASGMKQH